MLVEMEGWRQGGEEGPLSKLAEKYRRVLGAGVSGVARVGGNQGSGCQGVRVSGCQGVRVPG